MDKPKNTRRSFINYFLGGSFAAWFGFVVYPVAAYLKPPKENDSNVSAVKIDEVVNFPAGSGRVVPFGRKPALVIRVGNGSGSEDFKAFIATCTHLDCTVQYRKELNGIFCACHNGMYDLNGKNISGPPPRPLHPLKVNVQGGSIFLSREVT